MSLFLQAIQNIAYLTRKSDVVGKPRISISFDTDADEARFLVELNRDIANTVNFKYNNIAKYSETDIYGITVRIV